MDKGLDALELLTQDILNDEIEMEYKIIIEKELKALEIVKQKGIAFLVPNSDYSNERIHIDIYTNTLSEEELKMIKEALGL